MSKPVQDYATPPRREPLPPPNLKPRPTLFWMALGVFVMWLAVLVWIYVRQHS
ncbi:MAG: hypothetical protein QM754_12170 [Tepidisphaeraceae bacterium]